MPKPAPKRPSDRKSGAGRMSKQPQVGSTSSERQLFDLTKMQNEPVRLRNRHKLLRWSIPFVIIVALVALWFILPTPLTHEAIGDYNHKSYQPSRNWLTPLTWTSPQPFVIAFNSGTVDTQLANYTRAQIELTRALELATPAQTCMVVQNLVISLTDHATSLGLQAQNEDAASYNSQAAGLKLSYSKCFHIIAPKQSKHGGGGGGGGGGGDVQQILSQSQQQQLQQKNLVGQESQQQNFLQSAVNPNSPSIKPW
jgi:hypothetical protein